MKSLIRDLWYSNQSRHAHHFILTVRLSQCFCDSRRSFKFTKSHPSKWMIESVCAVTCKCVSECVKITKRAGCFWSLICDQNSSKVLLVQTTKLCPLIIVEWAFWGSCLRNGDEWINEAFPGHVMVPLKPAHCLGLFVSRNMAKK